MPNVGGRVGFYNGEVDTLATVLPCWDQRHSDYQFNSATYYAVRENYTAGYGLGSGEYYLMGGPGADPNYDGTTSRAYQWGQTQAARAYDDWQARANRDGPGSLPFRILWMDIEPWANDISTGWRSFVNACGDVTSGTVNFPTPVSRAVFNGFWDYLNGRCCLYPGVYSERTFWRTVFGTGPDGNIPNTHEWAYGGRGQHIRPGAGTTAYPDGGWYQIGAVDGDHSAVFFGGVDKPSSKAVAWQWHIKPQPGGDPYDGDYDSIRESSVPWRSGLSTEFAGLESGELSQPAAIDIGVEGPSRSAPPDLPRCPRGQLDLTAQPLGGGMNKTFFAYVLRNTSNTPCFLQGVPGFRQRHENAGEQRRSQVMSAGEAPSAVAIGAGERASFVAVFSGCEFDPSLSATNATVTEVTLPGDSVPLSLRSPYSDECRQVDISVTPVQPGFANPLG